MFCQLILEADGRLRARLIREGVSKNRNRWTRAMLERLRELSEGVPVHVYDLSRKGDGSMLHHWEVLRQKLPPAIRDHLPERLPGAQTGVVRNPEVVVEDDGRASLMADVEPDAKTPWFRQVVERVLRAGRELGISVHATPSDGVQHADGTFEPTAFETAPVGYDVVTNASAGGGFVPVLEALLEEREMKNLMKRLMRFVAEAKRGSLPTLEGDITKLDQLTEAWRKAFAAAAGIELGEDADKLLESLYHMPDSLLESMAAAPAAEGSGNPDREGDAGSGSPGRGGDADAGADSGDGRGAALEGRIATLEAQAAARAKENALALIEAKVEAAKLPGEMAKFARTQLGAMLESAGELGAKRIDSFIADLKKGIGAAQNAGGQTMLEGAGSSGVQLGADGHDKVLAAFDAMLEGVQGIKVGDDMIPAFRSIKHAYMALTGDVHCNGQAFRSSRRSALDLSGRALLESVSLEQLDIFGEYQAQGGAILEGVTTASFPLLLSDRMHKRLAKEYEQQPRRWRHVATPETVTDFKDWRILRMGEYGTFPTVAEDGIYQPVAATPSEEEVTLRIVKHGGLESITMETILNDDTRKVRKIPVLLARAYDRTLEYEVYGLILNNGAIYDAVALFHAASHLNLHTTGSIFDILKLMRKQMAQQKDIDSIEAGRVTPFQVLCGPERHDELYEVIYGPNKPSLASGDNQSRPNVLRTGKWDIVLRDPVHRFDDVDPDMVVMTADPEQTEMIVVGFLNGKEGPELFVQDLDRVGTMFDRDRITYKVRGMHRAVVADYRGFQGLIPA